MKEKIVDNLSEMLGGIDDDIFAEAYTVNDGAALAELKAKEKKEKGFLFFKDMSSHRQLKIAAVIVAAIILLGGVTVAATKIISSLTGGEGNSSGDDSTVINIQTEKPGNTSAPSEPVMTETPSTSTAEPTATPSTSTAEPTATPTTTTKPTVAPTATPTSVPTDNPKYEGIIPFLPEEFTIEQASLNGEYYSFEFSFPSDYNLHRVKGKKGVLKEISKNEYRDAFENYTNGDLIDDAGTFIYSEEGVLLWSFKAQFCYEGTIKSGDTEQNGYLTRYNISLDNRGEILVDIVKTRGTGNNLLTYVYIYGEKEGTYYYVDMGNVEFASDTAIMTIAKEFGLERTGDKPAEIVLAEPISFTNIEAFVEFVNSQDSTYESINRELYKDLISTVKRERWLFDVNNYVGYAHGIVVAPATEKEDLSIKRTIFRDDVEYQLSVNYTSADIKSSSIDDYFKKRFSIEITAHENVFHYDISNYAYVNHGNGVIGLYAMLDDNHYVSIVAKTSAENMLDFAKNIIIEKVIVDKTAFSADASTDVLGSVSLRKGEVLNWELDTPVAEPTHDAPTNMGRENYYNDEIITDIEIGKKHYENVSLRSIEKYSNGEDKRYYSLDKNYVYSISERDEYSDVSVYSFSEPLYETQGKITEEILIKNAQLFVNEYFDGVNLNDYVLSLDTWFDKKVSDFQADTIWRSGFYDSGGEGEEVKSYQLDFYKKNGEYIATGDRILLFFDAERNCFYDISKRDYTIDWPDIKLTREEVTRKVKNKILITLDERYSFVEMGEYQAHMMYDYSSCAAWVEVDVKIKDEISGKIIDEKLSFRCSLRY